MCMKQSFLDDPMQFGKQSFFNGGTMQLGKQSFLNGAMQFGEQSLFDGGAVQFGKQSFLNGAMQFGNQLGITTSSTEHR